MAARFHDLPLEQKLATESVVGIETAASDAEVTVTTALGRYRAERVVATTGAWMTDLTPEADLDLSPFRRRW